MDNTYIGTIGLGAPVLADTPNPKNTSSDHNAMASFWDMVSTILGGAAALRMPGAAENYLPQFIQETDQDYRFRRMVAPLTNIYDDISRNLSSKPFSKELILQDGASEQLKELAEDIDGQGNSLHVFARTTFRAGIDKGVDWIFVDHTVLEQKPNGAPITKQEQKDQHARPYWVRIPAERMLAVYSNFVDGKEIIVHARIYQPKLVRVGFSEKVVECVLVLDREPIVHQSGKVTGYGPATWTLWELLKNATTGAEKWAAVRDGVITIGVIPLVAFVTGARVGGSWRVDPPLRGIAYMQIDEFQQESNLKSVLDLTCFPMLAGNGVLQETDAEGRAITVPVGPRAVLFAQPNADGKHGEWKFIEPSASSIGALQAHLSFTQKSMKELGLQPLLPQTGNLTATATAVAAAKAHSAVQGWALALKEALEEAMELTALWMGEPDPEIDVQIHTDFGVDLQERTELDTLLKLRETGDLSQDTLWLETKRRGVLSDNFDAAKETAAIKSGPLPLQGQVPTVTEQIKV